MAPSWLVDKLVHGMAPGSLEAEPAAGLVLVQSTPNKWLGLPTNRRRLLLLRLKASFSWTFCVYPIADIVAKIVDPGKPLDRLLQGAEVAKDLLGVRFWLNVLVDLGDPPLWIDEERRS